MSRFTIVDGVLTKKGKQVHRFWKYKGYAVAVKDLKGIKGVRLHTQYDGVLYADTELFYKHGKPHTFKDIATAEPQLVLEEKYWTVESETRPEPVEIPDPQIQIELKEEYINNDIRR